VKVRIQIQTWRDTPFPRCVRTDDVRTKPIETMKKATTFALVLFAVRQNQSCLQGCDARDADGSRKLGQAHETHASAPGGVARAGPEVRGAHLHIPRRAGSKAVDIFNWGDLLIRTLSSRTGPPRDFVKELSPPGSIIGSPLALLGYGCFQFSAVKTKPLKHAQMERISAPTLLVYGTQETAEGARSHMQFFPLGRLEVLGNLGHMDVYEDANRLQRSFFEQ